MDIIRPRSVTEAVILCQKTGGSYLAGGTFSMVEIVNGRFAPETLIDLSLCPELYGITPGEGFVSVGALTTFTELEKSPVIKEKFPCLAASAASVGGPQVRNRGTLGGNICAASPAADAAAPLLALGASAVAIGARGKREIPLAQFFLAPKKTCLSPEEIVTGLIIPTKYPRSAFLKVGKRNALAVSSVSMALAGGEGEFSLAVGSVAPTPRLCPRTAAALASGDVEGAKLVLMEEICPIDDRWATAEYRRQVAKNAVAELFARVREEKI